MLDFSVLCKEYVGAAGRNMVMLASSALLLGGALAYFIFIVSSLQSLGSAGFELMGRAEPPGAVGQHWPVLVGAALAGLLINVRSLTVLIKLNILGVISVAFSSGLLLFVSLGRVFGGFGPGHHAMDGVPHVLPPPTPRWSTIKTGAFFFLPALISTGTFCHNIVLQMLDRKADRRHLAETNPRDLKLAFLAVTVIYCVTGIVSYAAFGNDPLLPQNFLESLPELYGPAVVARFLLLVQLMIVTPLLMRVFRAQLYVFWTRNNPVPTMKVPFATGLVMNALFLVAAVVLATYYPHVGNVMRFTGAVTGFIYIYTLPALASFQSSRLYLGKRFRPRQHLQYPAMAFFGLVILVTQFAVKQQE